MFFSAFVFAFLFLWVNFRQATRNNAAFGGVASTARSAFLDVTDPVGQIGIDLSPKFFKLAVATVSAIVALFFALGFRAQWDTYLRFRYGGFVRSVRSPLRGRCRVLCLPSPVLRAIAEHSDDVDSARARGTLLPEKAEEIAAHVNTIVAGRLKKISGVQDPDRNKQPPGRGAKVPLRQLTGARRNKAPCQPHRPGARPDEHTNSAF